MPRGVPTHLALHPPGRMLGVILARSSQGQGLHFSGVAWGVWARLGGESGLRSGGLGSARGVWARLGGLPWHTPCCGEQAEGAVREEPAALCEQPRLRLQGRRRLPALALRLPPSLHPSLLPRSPC